MEMPPLQEANGNWLPIWCKNILVALLVNAGGPNAASSCLFRGKKSHKMRAAAERAPSGVNIFFIIRLHMRKPLGPCCAKKTSVFHFLPSLNCENPPWWPRSSPRYNVGGNSTKPWCRFSNSCKSKGTLNAFINCCTYMVTNEFPYQIQETVWRKPSKGWLCMCVKKCLMSDHFDNNFGLCSRPKFKRELLLSKQSWWWLPKSLDEMET